MSALVRVQAVVAALEALPSARWQLVINERPASCRLVRNVIAGRVDAEALGSRDWFLLSQLTVDIERHAAAGGAS
jgi:hypothetical protein